MPRTVVTKTQAPGPYPTTAVQVVEVATNATDGNYFTMTGDELLLVKNTTVGSLTFTISSVPNQAGRSKDITTESIGAGVVKVLGPFKNKAGWATSGNALEFTASATGVVWSVIKLT
jgi:hypothetical protein